jgi:DNA gyrase subunit A
MRDPAVSHAFPSDTPKERQEHPMAKKPSGKKAEAIVPAEPDLQPITRTLEENFLPYAMSVIVARALPEIDGFKPSQRKLLYTMYKMGLLTGARTKSANVVGATMRLNPHGDQAIYETLVRLTRGNETLLHPFIDSKGNFGKIYSRDTAYAASRYTEVKLESICTQIFTGIDQDAVDFVPNYDNTMQEPSLLPTTYPNILVSPNLGIAASMACNICSFNLAEVCETTAALIKNPDHNIADTLKAPDFSTGGRLLYDAKAIEEIYKTGRGGIKVHSVWKYDKKQNCIEISEIPYTTTVEAIMDKVTELVKAGKIKEIADMRDETDKDGLKLTIDLKRGVDPELLMSRLMRQTPLEDTFSCNFNILICGTPKVMGIREILEEWTAWRVESLRRQIYFKLNKMKERLHLLLGLGKILLDIDKAIAIIRNTEEDAEVIPNLMIGFGIDETQANYIAEIKLRNINKEYILNRLKETDELQKEIAETEEILKSRKKIEAIIIKELSAVAKKFGQPRKTKILYEYEDTAVIEEEAVVADYPVHYFLTAEGYFKKVTPQSLRMSGEHKLKEGDRISQALEGNNTDELLFITDRQQVYKVRSADLEETRISVLGSYLPQLLEMDEGESVLFMAVAKGGEFDGTLLFVFENGKIARIQFDQYATKTNRRRLVNAYSDRSPLTAVVQLSGEEEIYLETAAGRALIFNSSAITPKTTRNSIGVSVFSVKAKDKVVFAGLASESKVVNVSRYRVRKIPAAGALLKPEDRGETQTALE